MKKESIRKKYTNSSFFNLLIKNNKNDINNFIIENGKRKPVCPICFNIEGK